MPVPSTARPRRWCSTPTPRDGSGRTSSTNTSTSASGLRWKRMIGLWTGPRSPPRHAIHPTDSIQRPNERRSPMARTLLQCRSAVHRQGIPPPCGCAAFLFLYGGGFLDVAFVWSVPRSRCGLVDTVRYRCSRVLVAEATEHSSCQQLAADLSELGAQTALDPSLHLRPHEGQRCAPPPHAA